jgi:hypothetical protein
MNQIISYLNRDIAVHTLTVVASFVVIILLVKIWILAREHGRELATTQDMLDLTQDSYARVKREVDQWRKAFGPFPSLYENSPEAEAGFSHDDMTIAVDLDGVILKYVDPWEGIYHFGDPEPGAAEALGRLKELGYKIVIYTTRNNAMANHNGGHNALELTALVQNQLEKHGIPYDFIALFKPLARYYIDDRAIRHAGDWGATLRKVRSFEITRLDERIKKIDDLAGGDL